MVSVQQQLSNIESLLRQILFALTGENRASGIRVLIDGKEIMPNTPINVGEKTAYLVQEIDKDGNVVPPLATDTVTVVSSDGAIVVLPDIQVAPGAIASGFLSANAAGMGVNVTATVMKGDGSVLGAPKVLTFDVSTVVVTPVATDITFTVGPNIPQ